MEMPSAPLDADETLAAIGRRIYRSFLSLEVDSKSYKDEDSFSSALLEESQRFGLWAKNLGLYDLGHSSLDYRFRDAPVVKNYTSHLLVDLEKSISKIQQDLDERRPGREKAAEQPRTPGKISGQAGWTIRDHNEDEGSDESSEDEEALMSYQEDSISTIVLENAKLIIDRLCKLSFKIRNPTTRLGFSKARSYREIDEETRVDLMDCYASFDLRHVAEILAQYWRISQEECENHYLVQRLARANTHRRRQFGQWRRHRLKLESTEKVFAQATRNKLNVQASPMLLNVPQGSEKSALSLPSTATRLEESNVSLNDTVSAVSSSTYPISFTEDNENDVSIPALPEKLRTGKEFECPYCHILCSNRTSNKIAWERHVLKDLRPYVCTYEDCKEGDQQFDNIKDWVSHEVNAHRDTKLQPASPSDQSSAAHGPDQDLKTSLPQNRHVNPNANESWCERCPICLKKHPSLSHAALHLQKIAIFALPNSTELDEDSTRGDRGSEAANIDDQSSMSTQGVSERSDRIDLDEDETDKIWKEWDHRTSRDVAPSEETRQKDVQHFENALQQVNKSTERGLDVNTFVAGVESDNSLLYRGESKSDGPIPKIYQLSNVGNLSFYARIDPLEPDYQAQPARYGAHNYWVPPNVKNGYTRRIGMLFHWMGGIITRVAVNHPVGETYSAATVFTQNPDTPHLLVVPFDAQLMHAYQNNGGWRPLVFHHVRINNTPHTYSFVSATGDRQHIAAPGSPHWMPQLLPRVYDYQIGSPRIQAGLIGSIPLLIALAAFSAPPAALAPVLTNCLQPGVWRPHEYQYPAGHLAERGMVVTVYFDPTNPLGSNPAILDRLQSGEFGPFYS